MLLLWSRTDARKRLEEDVGLKDSDRTKTTTTPETLPKIPAGVAPSAVCSAKGTFCAPRLVVSLLSCFGEDRQVR